MINSPVAFHAVVGIAVSKAIDEVLHRAEQELIKIIDQVVTNESEDYTPADVGISESWKVEVRGMFGELRHDPNLLSLRPSMWQHGSAYDNNWRDVRDIFIDIIQGGYNAYNAHTGRPIAPRPFWDLFMNKLNRQFDRWFRTALRRQGLMVI